ncbi:hypothetical protein HDU87_002491 [Geranomyces variabilis]|uniref:histidine kinase n=1 Tax=Geranomyces variabilis TaxID=109894 RepID=A0AAD5XLL7_9FUNG|nr:hypothetical protein HDU87_002491 [Geranomyces variabilis]
MPRPPRSAPSNISDSLASAARNQKFSRTGRLNLQKIVQKLKRLHIAGSTPSVSQSKSESDVSYTGPVRKNEGAIRLPRAGGIDPCNEDDMEDLDESADEIIVDGNLHPAVSSIDSRKNSITGSSAPSLSQTATTQNLGESRSARAHYSEHLFRFSAAIANSKAWHRLNVYLDQSFMDETIERQYQKEHWWLRKPLALLGAFFILLSWVLAVALVPKPWSTFDYYAYIGIVGFFSLMLPLAVIADVPRHSTGQWQLLLALTALSWPVVFTVEINLCGFYKDHPDNYFGGGACGNKDFSTMLLYAAAYPTVGLFALKQTRAWAALSGVAYVIIYSVAILPDRLSSFRTLCVYLTFEVFLNYMNYSHERLDRKVFLVREELKRQFKATQRARHLEFKASDSKKRFVSYIFHEVRVPLNAASLAVQNLEADGIFDQCIQDQRDIVDALRGSLGMMAKVLNDVLDFNRMEDGKLVVTRQSLEVHKVIRSLLTSERVVAQTRNIAISMQLDPNIDKLQSEKLLVGDEMRLRQILSNLLSNASKFTNPGGTVKVVTELQNPHLYGISSTLPPYGLQMDGRLPHDSLQIDMREFDTNRAVVRVEVHDTGVGIRRHDLIDNRLLTAYVQTDEGRRQGGKGTGLGLALVRHIIQLSGGRLGVKSTRGVGSIFWFELPFGLQNESLTPSVDFYPNNQAPEKVGPLTESIPVHRLECQQVASAVAGAEPSAPPELKDMSRGGKKVQIVEDNTGINTSVADIVVPAYLETGATAEVLREKLKDLGRMFNSEATEAPTEHVGSSSPSGENCDFAVNSDRPSEQLAVALATATPALLWLAQRHSSNSSANFQNSLLRSDPLSSATGFQTLKKAHVLIVDDDKITRLLMARLISRLGHTIVTAEDGAIALQKLSDAHEAAAVPSSSDSPVAGDPPFDVVFLDNQMPVMTGVECIREVRRRHNPVWACGVTGNALMDDQDEFYMAGIDRVLTKPVKEADVKEMISMALEDIKPNYFDRETWRKANTAHGKREM